jgi:hypothetical protein
LVDNASPRYPREIKEYWRQYDCHAITLESGLDLLKRLKGLRIVGLKGMGVYVDVDQEMAKLWPNAKRRGY